MKNFFLLSFFVASTTALLMAQQTTNSKPKSSSPVCNYTFINDVWDQGVFVQYSLGDQSNCAQKPIIETFNLAKGQQKTITSNKDLCWRRDKTPGSNPQSPWSVWTEAKCFGADRKIPIR